MFAHAAQKVFGWFGGPGFRGTLGYCREAMELPTPVAVLAIAAEFFGSVGLILGFFTRVAALAIALVMLFAIVLVHLRFGLFANWFGNKDGEGFEYHLLVITVAIVLVIRGAGPLSFDYRIASKAEAAAAPQEDAATVLLFVRSLPF